MYSIADGIRIIAKKTKDWSEKEQPKTRIPKGLFTEAPGTIAEKLLSMGKSPDKAIEMIEFEINRDGDGITEARKKHLQRAVSILEGKKKEEKKKEK